jgi:hypothetical protein
MTLTTLPKKNYLTNKDLLREIHRSKMTYCWISDPKYYFYDVILDDLGQITEKTLKEARVNRGKRIQAEAYAQASDLDSTVKQRDFAVNVDDISQDDLVFRVMTYAHIPDEEGRKKNPKTEAEEKSRVNFPPFKHYAYVNDVLTEVARSHWRGDLATGEFSAKHGRITDKLALMFLKLVERYSHRSNWRGYTYIDEMRGYGLLQLTQVGLQFNEAKSDNPFAYYTSATANAFTRVLNIEKRNQNIRDDILIDNGHLPSYSRQLAHEEGIREIREQATEDHSEPE